MLQKSVDFLANPTVRRLAVTLVGLGFAALNKRFGLNLDADQLYSLVALCVGYVAQSAFTQVGGQHADAKAALATAIANASPAQPAAVPPKP
jgi:hypothetical protein